MYIEYWKNGTIKARLPYKDGRAHGHLHGWYENGKDAFKGYFQEGVKQGTHLTFFEVIRDTALPCKARRIVYNMHGNLDGQLTRNYKSGELWILVNYKNGIANGKAEEYFENSNNFIVKQYKRGLLANKSFFDFDPNKVRADEKYVNEVTREFIRVAQKDFGVVSYGTGARMPYDVEEIKVSFSVKRKCSIEEARVLMVELKDQLAACVNKHTKLRPYLREYPFSSNRAKVSLAFCDKNGKDYDDGKTISYLCVGKNNTMFYTASSMTGDMNRYS